MEYEGRIATFATFNLFGRDVRVSLAYGVADLNLLASLAQAHEQKLGISPLGSRHEREEFNAGIARLRRDLKPYRWRIVQTQARKELSSGKPGYYILEQEPEVRSADQPSTNLISSEKKQPDVRQIEQAKAAHPWAILDKGIRDQVTAGLKSDIAPHVLRARRAHKVIKEIEGLRSSVGGLKTKAKTASPQEQEEILQTIGEAAERQADLGGQSDYRRSSRTAG